MFRRTLLHEFISCDHTEWCVLAFSLGEIALAFAKASPVKNSGTIIVFTILIEIIIILIIMALVTQVTP